VNADYEMSCTWTADIQVRCLEQQQTAFII